MFDLQSSSDFCRSRGQPGRFEECVRTAVQTMEVSFSDGEERDEGDLDDLHFRATWMKTCFFFF